MDRKQLETAFDFIENTVELPIYVGAIFKSMKAGECHSKTIDRILQDYNINESIAKMDFLHIILEYIQRILERNELTEETTENVKFLKLLFHIHPEDLHIHKKYEIEQLIKLQLANIYSDNYVSEEESFLKSELQELFDLSYDQMNEYAIKVGLELIKNGVNPLDLDIWLSHHEYLKLMAGL